MKRHKGKRKKSFKYVNNYSRDEAATEMIKALFLFTVIMCSYFAGYIIYMVIRGLML